jgi:hypothetical protein
VPRVRRSHFLPPSLSSSPAGQPFSPSSITGGAHLTGGMSPLVLRTYSPPYTAGAICRRRRKRPIRSVSVRASWQELAGVLVFSAVPFTAVKALAGSPLGARLRRRLEERKDSAAAEADALRAAARQARRSRYALDLPPDQKPGRYLSLVRSPLVSANQSADTPDSFVEFISDEAFGMVELARGGSAPSRTTTRSIWTESSRAITGSI